MDLPILSSSKQIILSKINNYFLNNRIGYIQAPTGWGKTLLSKHIINILRQQHKSILFIVSRNNQLLKQTAYKNNDKLLFPDSIILSSEDNNNRDNSQELLKKILNLPNWLIFASLQSLLSKNNIYLKLLIAQKVDFVIIDEIHNFIKNKGNEFINLINPKAKILGLTATPYQGLIGNMKYVDDISTDIELIHQERLLDCINNGILARLNYIIIKSNQNIMDVFSFDKGIKELTKTELYVNFDKVKNLLPILSRMQIAKLICQRIHNNSKTAKILIFCAPAYKNKKNKITALHAKLCAAVFNDESINNLDSSFSNYDNNGHLKSTVYLSSDLSIKEKTEILESFKTIDKPPYILCTVSMLVEGFDFPDLENLLLLRPTLSMRLFEQQIGRVLRPGILKQKNYANIFEIIDDTIPLYDTFKEQIFRSQSVSEQMQMISPLIKIEKLLLSNNTDLKGLDTESIKVKEIKQEANSLTIESLSLKDLSIKIRLLHIKKLLNIIRIAKYGSLKTEEHCLLDALSNLPIYTIETVKKVINLIKVIEKMESIANKEKGLSHSCRKHKPEVLFKAGQLLRLNLLSSLEKIQLEDNQKKVILKYLGYNGLDITTFDTLPDFSRGECQDRWLKFFLTK